MKPTFFQSVRITTAGRAQAGSVSQSGGWMGMPVSSLMRQMAALRMPKSLLKIHWNTRAPATIVVTTGMK